MSAAAKALVGAQIFTICTKYNANASFIQAAARDKAIATGNILLGVAMVQNAGYFLKLPKSSTTKTFSATPIGNNSVWIRTKAVATQAGYIRQYGPTTGFNIEPETLMETLYGIESEFVLQGLKKAGIYAMREASILPIPRKGDSGPNTTNVEEPATRALSAYAHKRIFQAADGIETSNYNWSDWIYFVVL